MNDDALTAVLPESAAANWRRTSPVAVLFFFGRILKIAFDAGWAAIAPIWAAISSGKGIWIIPGILVVLVLFAAWAGLSWLRFRYRLDGNKLLVRRGVIQREKLTIEFDKVQNTRVLEPFYVRPFGLALFEIDTAGSAGKEVTLGGIDLELARTLRDQVVVEQQPVSSDDETKPANANATLVLSRTPKDIALYGLTHNGLLWVAVLFGAVMSQVDWDDGGPVTGLMQSLDLASFGALAIVLIALFFAALLALLLPLLSIAGAFWRYHGYQLFRDGETWRRHAGLVSKHDETVKQHKVQALVWKQNFVARALGRINLQLQQVSAGIAAGNAGAAAAKRRFVVPTLKPNDAATLSAQLLPGAQVRDTQFSRVNRKYIRKNLLWGWSWIAALLCIAPTIAAGWMGLLVWPTIMLLGWLIVSQRWRKLGYAVRGGYGLVRKGFIGTRTTVFPLFKVQRVDIQQSPSQRRHDLAHLRIHLASQSISVDWMSLADARKFHDLALYHVETSEQNWF